MSARLDELLQVWFAGDPDAAQVRELAALLRADPAARRRLVDEALLDARLRRVLAERPPARRRRWLVPAIAAALLLVAAALALHARLSPVGPQVRSGTLLVDGGAVSALAPGRLAVAHDAVELALPDGTVVAAQPGTAFLLAMSGAVPAIELAQGAVQCRVVPGRGGLRVVTGVGAVNVLGTRFRVVFADPAAGMRVDVASGRVEVTAAGRHEVLTSGEARRFAPPGGDPLVGAIAEAAGGTLLLDLGPGAQRRVPVDEATAVEVGGRIGPPELLAIGDQVAVRLAADGATVARIDLLGASLRGTVLAVDVDRRALTLETVDGGRRDLAVADGATLRRGSAPIELAQLRIGAVVTVDLAGDRRTARAVVAVHAKGSPDAPKLAKADGEVVAVEGAHLVIERRNDGTPGQQRFGLSDGTAVAVEVEIPVDGGREQRRETRAGSLADLLPGRSVTVEYASDQLAERIVVRPPKATRQREGDRPKPPRVAE